MKRNIDKFLARFRRVTSGGRYIPEVDGLRFIAISIVVLQHISQSLPQSGQDTFGVRLINESIFGVELFFVISGFILALPFKSHALGLSRPVDIKAYYLRRLARLEPPYLLSLLLVAVGLAIAGRPLSDVALHLIPSFFYVSLPIHGQFHPLAINSVTWSLEVEVQFYIIAPLIMSIFMIDNSYKRHVISLILLIFIFIFSHIVSRIAYPVSVVSLLEYFQYFMVGLLVADACSEKRSNSLRADVLAIVAWLALPCLFQARLPGQSLLLALNLYVAVLYSLRSTYLRKALAHPVIATIGGMCYSIYLLHMPIIHWLVPGTHLPGSGLPRLLLEGVVYGAIIVAISAVFFVLVEKPCMKPHWWRSKRHREEGVLAN